jgi:hypothetical protein
VRRIPFLLLLAPLALPAVASAAPPANDVRTAPQAITSPVSVSGTTRDSTLDADEPSSCQALKGSVYYELQAGADARMAVRLAAKGDLDATVDVFRRTRSQLTSVDCDATDEDGQAELSFRAQRGAHYLVRVGQRANSVPGDFTLDVLTPAPPATAPGPRLPRGGATRTLDAIENTDDAWSTSLHAGVTYRINLASAVVRDRRGEESEGCVALQMFAPGTRDFEGDDPVRSSECGGYRLFTPGPGRGGRYSFLASAQEGVDGAQAYHLQVAEVGPDDLAPGLPLPDFSPLRGTLDPSGIDAVDVYRFDVLRRSALRLSLTGRDAQLSLLTTGGRRIATEEDGVDRQVPKGRYVVAVTAGGLAGGRYTLTRTTRTITRTSIAIDGRRDARSTPGRSTRIGLATSPRVSGPVTVTIERFDPLAGWMFHRQIRTEVRDGRGAVPFTPPATGRWRARASFTGTRTAAPSHTGNATVTVEGPLRDR